LGFGDLGEKFMKLKDFKIYQKAKLFYTKVLKLDLPYYLEDQVRRASSSIVLNLAEGSGKNTTLQRRWFFNVALGSIRECQAVFEISGIEDEELLGLLDELGAGTYRLVFQGK
jgi:four helix bundle protein